MNIYNRHQDYGMLMRFEKMIEEKRQSEGCINGRRQGN